MTKYKTIKSRLLNDYVACSVDCNNDIKIRCIPINGDETITLPLHKILSTDEEIIDSLISFLGDGDDGVKKLKIEPPEEMTQPVMPRRTYREMCRNATEENDSDEPIGRPVIPRRPPREGCNNFARENNTEEFLHQLFGNENPTYVWRSVDLEDSE